MTSTDLDPQYEVRTDYPATPVSRDNSWSGHIATLGALRTWADDDTLPLAVSVDDQAAALSTMRILVPSYSEPMAPWAPSCCPGVFNEGSAKEYLGEVMKYKRGRLLIGKPVQYVGPDWSGMNPAGVTVRSIADDDGYGALRLSNEYSATLQPGRGWTVTVGEPVQSLNEEITVESLVMGETVWMASTEEDVPAGTRLTIREVGSRMPFVRTDPDDGVVRCYYLEKLTRTAPEVPVKVGDTVWADQNSVWGNHKGHAMTVTRLADGETNYPYRATCDGDGSSWSVHLDTSRSWAVTRTNPNAAADALVETVQAVDADKARIAELERLVARYERGIERAAEIAREQAERRNWCSEYEDFAQEANRSAGFEMFAPRAQPDQEYTVEWEETYRVTRRATWSVADPDHAISTAEETGALDTHLQRFLQGDGEPDEGFVVSVTYVNQDNFEVS